MATILIRTQTPQQAIDITRQIAEQVVESGIDDGICHVYVPHATAAVVLNESADPEISTDLLEALDGLIPAGRWRHDRIDDNGAAHLKAAILGPSESVPIVEGQLGLGTWQAILLVDFDGPRQRTVRVTVTASAT